jgi:hypothetical protein
MEAVKVAVLGAETAKRDVMRHRKTIDSIGSLKRSTRSGFMPSPQFTQTILRESCVNSF